MRKPPFSARISTVASIVLTASVSIGTAESRTRFEWPGWKVPARKVDERSHLTIPEDSDAESVRTVVGQDGKPIEQHVALMMRVSRRTITKSPLMMARTPIVTWASIEPGLYRATARVSFDGDVGLIGTPIELTISNAWQSPRDGSVGELGGNSSTVGLHGCDVEEPDTYHLLSLLHEVTPDGQNKRLKRRRARGAYRWAYWPYKDAYPEYEPPPRKKPKARPKEPAGVFLRLGLPRTEYNVTQGKPPNSLRSVRLDWIRLEKLEPAPIAVRHVRPQKLRMRPGDTNTFHVSLENFTGETHQRTLKVSLLSGLNRREQLHTATVELAPGAAREIDVPWPTTEQTSPWGYEVLAEILSGNTVESSARDFFSVHKRAYAVLVKGGRSRHVDPFRENETYTNLREDFGITSGDMAEVRPPPGHEEWAWGMGGSAGAVSYRLCRAAIAHNRANGIATTMYLWSGGTGRPVMDLYVTKPEWLAGRVLATDQVYGQYREREAYVRQHDFSAAPPIRGVAIYHVQQMLNHWSPQLQAQIEAQTIEFLRNTGYDGIRFDEGFFPPRGTRSPFGETLPLGFEWKQQMEVAARQFESFRDKLRAEFPGLEFGGNRESFEYISHVGNRGRPAPPPETYPEFVAFCRAGGMLMDEPTMEIPSFGHPMNRFEDAIYGMCQKRAMCRRFGGIYQLFSPGRDGTGHFAHDDIYFATMIVTSGSVYVGGFPAPPFSKGSIAAFITRFSEFFRSFGLKPLDAPEEKIFPDADEDLWFADTAVYEDVGDRRRYVIPMINPPVVERFRQNRANEFPYPIGPFPISVAIPDGYRAGEAWMLTWEPDVMVSRLEATAADGRLEIEFPGIQLCRTLVVEFAK